MNKLGFYVFAGCLNGDGTAAKQLLLDAEYKNRIMVLQLNVTKQDEISNAFEKVQKLLTDQSSMANELYAVFNNAGIGLPGLIEWGKADSIENFENHVNINTYGVIRVTKKFLPLIRKSKGRIINLSSIASRCTVPGLNPYSLSKAATAKFSEGLAEELAEYGIKAIDIQPWFCKTPILNPANLTNSYKKWFDESADEIKQFYGQDKLNLIVKCSIKLVTDPNIVMQDTKEVVDMITDAVTSAEPDVVYRVISPGFGAVFWIIHDLLPIDLTIPIRRFGFSLLRYLGD